MAFVLDKVSEDTFYENMLLGFTKVLEKKSHIKNVHLERQPACSLTEVLFWEQIHGVRLPEDLKSFYLAADGITVSWSYEFSEQEILDVGYLRIRPVVDLNYLSECNLQIPADLKPLKNKFYHYCTEESRVYHLATVSENANVCLVYGINRTSPAFFLIENYTYCYYLTNSFKKYLSMAIAHLGLPMWQYCFTPQGVPSWVDQMFNMIAPHLETSEPVVKTSDEQLEDMADSQNYPLNKVDSSVFKIKRRTTSQNGDALKHRKKL